MRVGLIGAGTWRARWRVAGATLCSVRWRFGTGRRAGRRVGGEALDSQRRGGGGGRPGRALPQARPARERGARDRRTREGGRFGRRRRPSGVAPGGIPWRPRISVYAEHPGRGPARRRRAIPPRDRRGPRILARRQVLAAVWTTRRWWSGPRALMSVAAALMGVGPGVPGAGGRGAGRRRRPPRGRAGHCRPAGGRDDGRHRCAAEGAVSTRSRCGVRSPRRAAPPPAARCARAPRSADGVPGRDRAPSVGVGALMACRDRSPGRTSPTT